MKKTAVLAAMSGGVDSSVAASLLTEEAGYRVAGATLKMLDSDESVALARDSACVLGIKHYVFDCRDEFEKQIVSRFCEEYLLGRTPNPCAVCNERIKFGVFLEKAKTLGFDKIATGHYVRSEKSGKRLILKKACFPEKDQSYFLYMLTQEQLSHTLFPLGGMRSKEEVRNFAASRGLENAQKGESQDICFIPGGDYAAFIEEHTGIKTRQGSFLDTDGAVIGEHKGHIRYTVGQRRGLGVGFCKPMYVKSKNAAANTVTLSDNEALYEKRLEAEGLNFIPFERFDSAIRVKAKIRYRHEAAWATVEQIEEDRLRVEFDTPQRAISPGQAVVLYDGDVVVGGGTIC